MSATQICRARKNVQTGNKQLANGRITRNCDLAKPFIFTAVGALQFLVVFYRPFIVNYPLNIQL